jgi:hypothetical protein
MGDFDCGLRDPHWKSRFFAPEKSDRNGKIKIIFHPSFQNLLKRPASDRLEPLEMGI